LPRGGSSEDATAAELQQNAVRRNELHGIEYLALAEQLLHPPCPSLVAIGGFSGSGKSTLALGLAPFVGAVPGAVVLRSDENACTPPWPSVRLSSFAADASAPFVGL